jgi:hypothetical protein
VPGGPRASQEHWAETGLQGIVSEANPMTAISTTGERRGWSRLRLMPPI